MRQTNTRPGATKPAGSPYDMPKTETPQALRQIADSGTEQAQEIYAKMSAATVEASNLIQTSCATAAKGAGEYHAKVVEIARANANAAFDYARDLNGVRSPSEFLEVTTDHARKGFDVLSEQTKELAALAQKAASEAAETLNAGMTPLCLKML
jgi:phasin